MKKEIADKWIAALRSGEYKQGRNMLRNHDRFCCLGVLCDLAAKEGIGEWKEEETFVSGRTYKDKSLSPSVCKWSGVFGSEGFFQSIDGVPHTSLTALNDSSKWNFKQIADFIEQHWEKL